MEAVNQPIEPILIPEKDREAFQIVQKYARDFFAELKKTTTTPESSNYLIEVEPVIDAFLQLAQEPKTQHRTNSFFTLIANKTAESASKTGVSGWKSLDSKPATDSVDITIPKDAQQPSADLMKDVHSPAKTANVTHGM